MPQSPLKADQIQIEPGSGDTLTINRDSGDGSLHFVDAVVTGGVNLQALVGTRTITGVYIVGRAGTGAAYTTIQSALDAVPDASSASAPSLVLVYPGVYEENITISKDGVFLVGVGGVTISNPAGTADATVTIEAGASTTPTKVVLANLRITNGENGEECLLVSGAAASTVASDGVLVKDCELVASGVGTYQIYANIVNHIEVRGGSWAGSSSTSNCRVAQCASFRMFGVRHVNDLELAYDSTGSIPSVATSEYEVRNIGRVGNVLATLSTVGSLAVSSCGTVGDVTLGGNRSVTVSHSQIGDITVGDTTAATLVQATRGAAAGTGTLAESVLTGSVAFAASTSETVAFDVAQPDALYAVSVDSPVLGNIPQATSKAAASFTLTTSSALTGTVYYTVMRQI